MFNGGRGNQGLHLVFETFDYKAVRFRINYNFGVGILQVIQQLKPRKRKEGVPGEINKTNRKKEA